MDDMRLNSIFSVLVAVLCLGTAVPVTGQSTAPEDNQLRGLLETLGSLRSVDTDTLLRCISAQEDPIDPAMLQRCIAGQGSGSGSGSSSATAAGPIDVSRIEGPPPPELPLLAARDDQGRMTMRVVRLDEPLTIDGKLDEDLYHTTIPVTDFIQSEPVPDAPATEKTELWMAFDEDNLYVVFKAWESEPDRMVVTEMRRDSVAILQNAHVAFFLDPFYTRRNSYQFMINANGGRMDGQTVNEVQYTADLNPIWDIGMGKFDGGWIAETAIPFKSLRYPSGRNQVWGFVARRVNRWKNEIAYTSYMPKGIGLFGIMKASAGGTLVGIEPPSQSGRNIEIKPYATSDFSSALPAGNSSLGHVAGANFGVDAKISLTQGLNADFTYNTDFAQVEVDTQQVNLTRFSLYFPEKRDFFLENSGTFNFGGSGSYGGGGLSSFSGGGQGTGGGDVPRLFYSRQIGLANGQLVPIQGGGRVTGRLGGFELGMLNIQTGDIGWELRRSLGTTQLPNQAPSETTSTNFGVFRIKRDLWRRSHLGALYTRRSNVPGRQSAGETYGIDAQLGFGNDFTSHSYWARTQTTGITASDNTSYRAQVDYNADRWGVQAEHLVVEKGFNPELGFLRRNDLRKNYVFGRFSPRPKAGSFIRRYSFSGSLNHIASNETGLLETRRTQGDFRIEFLNGDSALFGVADRYEYLPYNFPITSNVTIPIGGYQFQTVRAGFFFGQHRRVSGGLSAEIGEFYNGKNTTVRFSGARVSMTPLVYVEPMLSFNWIDLPGGSFDTKLIGSRVTYTPTPLMFASALIQYNSTNNRLDTNVRLRWEYQPGSEIFIVYNEQRNTTLLDPSGVISRFPWLTNRALIVKINRLVRF